MIRRSNRMSSKVAQHGVVRSEFVFETAPFAQCHASTIERTPAGLVAAWFGGTREMNPDVGIWLSRHEKGKWTKPVEVAIGKGDDDQPLPCWNPVLFQPRGRPLMLFYKVGPEPSKWWGMLMTSQDNGKTWSSSLRLPDGMLGPIKNKPIQLSDGTILCPSSDEAGGWKVHIESIDSSGKGWARGRALSDSNEYDAIQPTILRYPSGDMQVLCRSQQGRVVESWSHDNGKSWSKLGATAIPNPNSGLDAVMLRDGRALLVYNHATTGRSELHVAVSSDGRTWRAALQLENAPGEYSYPAVIQARDGLVHITYTWKRERIKHVVLDPKKLRLQDMALAWPEAQR